MIAYCRLRQAIRDFRTDRIVKLKNGINTFDPTVHGNYLDHVSEIYNSAELVEVRIEISKKIAHYLQSQKYYYGFVQQVDLKEDTVEMVFSISEIQYFARWLVMFGKQVRAVSPVALQEEMKRLSL